MELPTWISNAWFIGVVASIIGGLLIFLLSVPLSSRLISRHLRSAQTERAKAAENELLDLLENMMVRGEPLTIEKIDNLASALDRKHGITSLSAIAPVTILRALELGFQESKHLAADQKLAHTERIESLIQTLRTEQRELVVREKLSEDKVINELRMTVEAGDRKSALEILGVLSKRVEWLSYQAYGPPWVMSKTIKFIWYSYSKNPTFFVGSLIIVTALYVWIVWKWVLAR